MADALPENKSPMLVALAGWALPGGGYWLIGQKARGVTIGVTITLLFVLGLLIGGVRAIEVPGWDVDGSKIRLNAEGYRLSPVDSRYPGGVWVMRRNKLSEIRSKPWSIAQGLIGPIAIAGGAWSIRAASGSGPEDGDRSAAGVTSHGRVNEIGVLYTAVAGMLNLLAIIDASHRATRAGEP